MATSSDKDPLGGSKFKVDPEYEALVPRPSREAYLALRESIRKDGQLVPIIVNENFVVLDGHQRLRACNELGITPAYDMATFPSRLEEKAFVIKTNLVRRQMKPIERIELVCKLEAIEKEKAKARQLAPLLRGRKPPLAQNCADGEKERGKVSAILAKAAGVSQTTLEEGKYVLKHGTPAQISRIRYSGATIHGTYKLLRTAAKLPFTGKVVQVSEAVQLIHGDYRTVTDRDLAQTQIKLIIGAADPFAGELKR
jgi:hypothetical protein